MYNGECHVNLLRKMQASFAWDWGLAAPSMGIWKNVYLDTYDSIVIRDITHQLIDGPDDEGEAYDDDVWTLKIFVHLETGLAEAEFQGVIAYQLM
jgi:beta-mannosidase